MGEIFDEYGNHVIEDSEVESTIHYDECNGSHTLTISLELFTKNHVILQSWPGKIEEQWLIKWRGAKERTRENVAYISQQFPYLNFDGSVNSQMEGIVENRLQTEENE